tara:strand:- start:673 stop:1911 length:1239 start_codon:yes stop_codon:yes gene_type:complete
MKKIELDKDINLYSLSLNKDVDESPFKFHNQKSIELKHLGKYLYTNNDYYANIDLADSFLKALNKENVNKDYLMNNVSTMYRFPKLTLSRDKLSSLQKDCNFRIIRDRTKADMWVISQKTLVDMTNMTYRDGHKVESLLNILNLYHSKFRDPENSTYISNFIKDIEMFKEDDLIVIEQNWYTDDDVTSPDYLTFIEMNNKLDALEGINRGRGYIHYLPDPKEYQELVNNADKIIIDSHVNKLCVEDSVSFNKDDFERLEQLFKSEDNENINIALTLMANCNVEGSKTVLSLIFAFYSEGMKGVKVWNHVNFKYLRKIYEGYINMTMSSWGNAYDSLIKKLCEDKCLSMWSSRYIANKMFVNVLQNNCGAFTKDAVFVTTVESLQLKDEYKNQITNDEQNISELVETFDDLPF